jgi:hypothetical protein
MPVSARGVFSLGEPARGVTRYTIEGTALTLYGGEQGDTRMASYTAD